MMQLKLSSLNGLGDADPPNLVLAPVTMWDHLMAVASLVSGAAGAYHGYKRHNGSIGWGIGWGLLSGIFVGIGPAIAIAQGFGKPMKKES